jgi:hypothetical protein
MGSFCKTLLVASGRTDCATSSVLSVVRTQRFRCHVIRGCNDSVGTASGKEKSQNDVVAIALDKQ